MYDLSAEGDGGLVEPADVQANVGATIESFDLDGRQTRPQVKRLPGFPGALTTEERMRSSHQGPIGFDVGWNVCLRVGGASPPY